MNYFVFAEYFAGKYSGGCGKLKQSRLIEPNPTLWQLNSDPSSPDDRTSGEEGLLATTTYFNDFAGNVTKSTTSGVSIFYDYDAAGRLYEVDTATKTTFTYNADHQQILKQTNSGSTGFLFDGKKLLHETNGLGTRKGGLVLMPST